MAKLVEFLNSDGVKVYVNVDQITWMRGDQDCDRTHIFFNAGHGVTVEGHHVEVVLALRAA